MIFPSNATWIDLVIVLAYLVLIMWIGVHFARRQKTMKEYFLAGQNMSWFPVGLSLMGAIHSGIQYIQAPSAANRYGTIFLIQVTSWLLIYPWAMWVILPFYRRLGAFTCYEYLENRFGRGVRGLAAVIFLFWRIGWISTALYAPSLAVYAVSGGRINIQSMVIILGAVVTISTMLGGMRAVIWTDVLQFIIMVGGLGLSLFMVIRSVPGGLPAILRIAHAAGKLTLFQSVPPEHQISAMKKSLWLLTAETSGLGIALAAFVGRLANYSTDQVMIQRFQTTRTLKDARQALMVNAISDVLWFFTLIFVGIALFAYFHTVGTLPRGIRPDDVFPYFMANVFPTGVIGLVIATIFAASLATMGSAINSCTSVTIIDLCQFKPSKEGVTSTVQPLVQTTRDEGGAAVSIRETLSTQQRRVEVKSLAASRWLTLVYGVLATAIGTQLGQIGDMIKISNLVIQTLSGPLLGIYLLGMFTHRTHQTGVLIGAALGSVTGILLGFYWKVGFVWPAVYGLFVTLSVGYLISVLTPMLRRSGMPELTWRRVMARAIPANAEQAVL